MRKLLLVLCTLFLFAGACSAQMVMVNVKDMGAMGDGVADDTKAFRNAIENAKQNKVDVYVPYGKYVISDTIELDDVMLVGNTNGAWNADSSILPTIIPVGLENPTVKIIKAGGVTGIEFVYNQNFNEPIAFPEAINIIGTGAWIRNVKMFGAYKGIVAEGKIDASTNPGRLNFENIFMVNIVNTGVYINGTRDVSLLENVEVWSPNVNMTRDRPVGFHLKCNDGLKMSNCFSFALQIGFLFEHSVKDGYAEGSPWVTMTDCMADYCGEGIVVKCFDDPKRIDKKEDYHSTITVNGGTFWAHGNSVRIEECSNVFTMSAADLRANGGSNVIINGGKNISFANCRIAKEMPEHKAPSIVISGGENINISNNIIGCTNVGFLINDGFKKLLINNNIITSATNEAVKDNSKKSKTKSIKDNL